MSALFSPLEIVDCPLPPKLDLGDKPRLEWLPVASLRIDTGYQRPIMQKGRANIAHIVQEFSWSRFSPLVVTPIVQGLYAVIDGQHRATAAQRLGITEVPCQIVAVNAGDAASIFSTINGNVTPISAQNIFKAALAAKDEWALTIYRLTNEVGVEILTYPVESRRQKPRQTMMVGTLRQRLSQLGHEMVSLALEGLMASPKSDTPGFVRAMAFDEALIRIKSTPDALANRASTISALSRIDYQSLTSANRTRSTAVRLGHLTTTIQKSIPGISPLHIIKADDKAKILDWHRRKYSPSQIAAVTKLPYSEVAKVIAEASP